MDGTPIEQVSSFRLLRVTVSDNLSWAPHIQATCCKAKKVLGLLYRSFGLAGELCLTRLYKALVRPLLEYCDCVWSPHQAKYVTMLERVQSFAARVATRRWDESSASLRDHLHWPLLPASRRQFHRLLMCRRIITERSIMFCVHPPPFPSSASCELVSLICSLC